MVASVAFNLSLRSNKAGEGSYEESLRQLRLFSLEKEAEGRLYHTLVR